MVEPFRPKETPFALANCIVPAVTVEAAEPAMPEIPVCALCVGPMIVTVPLAPLTLWESVIFVPPAKRSRTAEPDAMPDVPDVFPRFDMPPDCDQAEGPTTEMVAPPAAED